MGAPPVWLRAGSPILSGFSSAMVAAPARTSSLLWLTSNGPSGGSSLRFGEDASEQRLGWQQDPDAPLVAGGCLAPSGWPDPLRSVRPV